MSQKLFAITADDPLQEQAMLRIDKPPVTLREMALERLRNAIIAGTFRPGQRLVERPLCDKLGVSRSVIREVLRYLEAEGLVETVPKQGPIVALIAWDQARQIYDIRIALETTAVADCARSAEPEIKEKLRIVLEDLDRNSRKNDALTILAATNVFYETIFLSGGHEIAWDIVKRLNGRISRLRVMTLATANRTISGPANMRAIFDAILRNDPDAATAACRAHITEAARIAEGLLTPKIAAGPELISVSGPGVGRV
ncbi:GntR family transcriptional regulator [Rhizobium leguminosarum bv. viciae]|uniref:GntR family transcriptional regulator n=1 Tax=Rhizobium leguminosarum TaxID=384 RepID=UPI00103DE448|nr:GntR family transcriptional regulator [Rhizobium leguminosarum]MBY5345154.1 GntR family transcriptional regulator [Rhizobium leguminosarum]NKK53906.1 FCD domain-containing protein [Rhizobium leguminosarum bv. viciae]TBY87277.1 GntR family transcriptional regulator [Rhizobium leguminosarum bv. viciae]